MALIYNKWNDIMTKAFTNQNDWMSQLYHQQVHLLEYFLLAFYVQISDYHIKKKRGNLYSTLFKVCQIYKHTPQPPFPTSTLSQYFPYNLLINKFLFINAKLLFLKYKTYLCTRGNYKRRLCFYNQSFRFYKRNFHL